LTVLRAEPESSARERVIDKGVADVRIARRGDEDMDEAGNARKILGCIPCGCIYYIRYRFERRRSVEIEDNIGAGEENEKYPFHATFCIRTFQCTEFSENIQSIHSARLLISRQQCRWTNSNVQNSPVEWISNRFREVPNLAKPMTMINSDHDL
jgi:hypothetical protein